MASERAPVWFITGCSSGFGRALAALVLERGWCAAVTARDPRRAEVIVGTSAGSVAGALLRAGFSASDLYEEARAGRPSWRARRRLQRDIAEPAGSGKQVCHDEDA